jgi:hypothetical protein
MPLFKGNLTSLVYFWPLIGKFSLIGSYSTSPSGRDTQAYSENQFLSFPVTLRAIPFGKVLEAYLMSEVYTFFTCNDEHIWNERMLNFGD